MAGKGLARANCASVAAKELTGEGDEEDDEEDEEDVPCLEPQILNCDRAGVFVGTAADCSRESMS